MMDVPPQGSPAAPASFAVAETERRQLYFGYRRRMRTTPSLPSGRARGDRGGRASRCSLPFAVRRGIASGPVGGDLIGAGATGARLGFTPSLNSLPNGYKAQQQASENQSYSAGNGVRFQKVELVD